MANELNPYASFLGGDDPLAIVSSTPEKIKESIESVSPAQWDEPIAPGKWSRRQIVCHLADTEITFAFRLRQTLAQDDHVIQPFDQDQWANRYPAYTMEAALQTFTAVRNWNIALLRSVPDADQTRRVTHPERGTMTFRTIVETMAGHDNNHLRQLR